MAAKIFNKNKLQHMSLINDAQGQGSIPNWRRQSFGGVINVPRAANEPELKTAIDWCLSS